MNPMMKSFPVFPKVQDSKKELQDLDFKISITQLRTDTLELRYKQLAEDNKAIEEATNTCFSLCEKNAISSEDALAKATTSIYREIAVLAKYQQGIEARFKEQEERHAAEKKELMTIIRMFNDRDAKIEFLSSKMDYLQARQIYTNPISDRDLFEMFEGEDEIEDEIEDEVEETVKEPGPKETYPIAQSLSEMLYEKNYPTL